MAVILRTPASIADYRAIWHYVAQNSVAAAEKLLRAFDAELLVLAAQRRLGRARDELRKGLRSRPVGSYVIFYRARTDGIELIRVLHGARNVKRIFKRRLHRRREQL